MNKINVQHDFFYKDNVSSEIIKFLLSETHKLIIIDKQITNTFFDWFNNNITNLMTYKKYIQYAVFATELVLPIFEKAHPTNKIPRSCVVSAKICSLNPSPKNKRCSYISYSSFYSNSNYKYISHTDGAATDVGRAAAYAAYAANTTTNSAYYSARSVTIAYNVADKKIRNKIMDYSLKLLEGL